MFASLFNYIYSEPKVMYTQNREDTWNAIVQQLSTPPIEGLNNNLTTIDTHTRPWDYYSPRSPIVSLWQSSATEIVQSNQNIEIDNKTDTDSEYSDSEYEMDIDIENTH